MCNLFEMAEEFELRRNPHGQMELPGFDARTVGPFQSGLFLRPKGDVLFGEMGQWGLIRPGQPQRIDYIQQKAEPGKKPRAPKARSTNNARIEDIERKPTFKEAWKQGRRCLVPAAWYQEPNWETKKNIWWRLRRADGQPWFLAGLWSEWTDPDSGELVPNFTVITCNCDGHPLLARLHKPDPILPPDAQDKRSLAHINHEDWGTWLHGSEDQARSLIKPQPMDVFDLADALATDQVLASQGNGQGDLL